MAEQDHFCHVTVARNFSDEHGVARPSVRLRLDIALLKLYGTAIVLCSALLTLSVLSDLCSLLSALHC